MTTFEVLTELFEYNAWANVQVIESLRQMPEPDPRALSLFAHILAASHIWHARLTSADLTGIQVHPDLTFDECVKLNDTLNHLWWNYLKANRDNGQLTAKMNYVNTAGKPFTKSVRGILIHVCNHSTYHRGQVASAIRTAGGAPPVTDFILFTD